MSEADAILRSGQTAASQRRALFAKSSVPSYILTLVVSVALVYTVSFAFKSAPLLRQSIPLIALVDGLLLLLMHFGAWSKRAALGFGVATVVICAAVLFALTSLSPTDAQVVAESAEAAGGGLTDSADNYLIFGIVLCAVPAAVFLLSRRPVGLVILLVADVVACGAVQFLYRDWLGEPASVLAPMIALAGIIALFVYQTYRQSVYSARRVSKTAFGGMAVFATALAAACVVMGMAVFFGTIDRLDLQTMDIKPFEVRHSRPIDEKEGVYQQQDVEGDNTTSETNDEERKTNQDATSEGGVSGMEDSSGMMDTPIGRAVQYLIGYDPNDPSQDRMEINYLILRVTAAIVAAVLLLVLVAAIIFQKLRRKRRLKKLAELPRGEQAVALYSFLLGRLRRLGLRKPDSLTPFEFALGAQRALAPFARNTNGATFLDVSIAYVDAAWGARDIEADKYDKVVDFYKAFFKNAREYVGWPKWLLYKFWRI